MLLSDSSQFGEIWIKARRFSYRKASLKMSATWRPFCLGLDVLGPGPIFCLLLGVSSDYAQPITAQVTEVTCPVIGRTQPELTPSKRHKMGPALVKIFMESPSAKFFFSICMAGSCWYLVGDKWFELIINVVSMLILISKWYTLWWANSPKKWFISKSDSRIISVSVCLLNIMGDEQPDNQTKGNVYFSKRGYFPENWDTLHILRQATKYAVVKGYCFAYL